MTALQPLAAAKTALERVHNLTCKGPSTDVQLSLALCDEYFRRMALWSNAIGIEGNMLKWGFYDVSDKVLKNNALIPELENLISNEVSIETDCGFQSRNIALWYIRWEYHKNTSSITRFKLPHPYNPLIVAFELNTVLTVNHGRVEVNGNSIAKGSIDYYLAQEPLAIVNDLLRESLLD